VTLSSSHIGRVGTFAALVAVGVLVFVVGLTVPGVDFDDRVVADTDGYMRMTRIMELRTGEAGWFESTAARSNAPFGHGMHWTRALDVVVLALAAPLDLFMPTADAVYAAGVAVGPLLLAATSAAVVWAAAPLVGLRGGVVAGIAVALQPTVMAYGTVARVDHHSLLFLLFVLFLGFGLRVVRLQSPGAGAIAGVTAAAGLWVSTEFLLPLALGIVAVTVAWLMVGEGVARLGLWFTTAWLAATVLLLLVERGWDGLESADLDRISGVHVVVAGLVVLFWLAAVAASVVSRRGRLWFAVGVGGALAVLLVALVPSFVRGPFGDVPPELWDGWLAGVAELQSLWPIGGSFAAFVYLMGAPLLAIPLAWLAAKRSSTWTRYVWWFGLAALVVLAGLSIFQLRFSAYPQILAVFALGWMTAELLDRVGDHSDLRSAAGRVGANALGVVGFLVPALLVAAFPGSGGSESSTTALGCDWSRLADVVRQTDGEPVVLAHLDAGPRLLYTTDARVVASPYHRNVDGILDGRRFLLGDEDTARGIVERRGVSIVAVCPSRERAYLGAAADDLSAFFGVVTSGDVPGWLMPVPASDSDDLRIFWVDRQVG